MVRFRCLAWVMVFLNVGFSATVWAQGQDSTTAERDLMVIAEMLPGIYANSNQAYFDSRLARPQPHQPLTLRVDALPVENVHWFTMGFTWGAGDTTAASIWLFQLELRDNKREVWANVAVLDAAGLAELRAGGRPRESLDGCSYRWSREPAQFKGAGGPGCGDGKSNGLALRGLVLSEPEFWLEGLADGRGNVADYALHRARPFQCYVDIPGVGGGRDEPYRRYEGFQIHDAGGEFWIDTDEKPSRRIGVNLFKVDWPINNYEGVFTRNVLVIYVNEIKDGKRIAHGYSFSEPTAERLGINLKWLLAYCYRESNQDARPAM